MDDHILESIEKKILSGEVTDSDLDNATVRLNKFDKSTKYRAFHMYPILRARVLEHAMKKTGLA